MKDSVVEMAVKLDQFAEEFDSYDYKDQVEDSSVHIQQIQSDLQEGKLDPYRSFLNDVIENAQDKQDVVASKALLKSLDQFENEQDIQKPSVRESLKMLKKQTPTVNHAHKPKEQER